MTTAAAPTPEQIDALRAYDTPTICNGLEVVAPDRRGHGFTTKPFVCAHPELGPMVGFARTGAIRAGDPGDVSAESLTERRLDYYDHVGSGPVPTITVIEDLDDQPGFGAFWGEVNTHLHQGLGSLGVITNGSIRDLPDSAVGFQLLAGMVGPSHAWVRIEHHGMPVAVHGMTVNPGDLIHADQHGAVVVPLEAVVALPAAIADIVAKEQRLITASRQPGFNADVLRGLMVEGPGH